MTQKFPQVLVFTLMLILLMATTMVGQLCEGKKRTLSCQKQQTTTPLVEETPKKRVKIKLPPNYKPPVANPKLIMFPETVASKKKQKFLLKKRKNRKKQGCIAANM